MSTGEQVDGPAAGSTALSRGRYALYETPGGGAVLSWRPDGAAEDLHQPVPAPLWRLIRAAAAGEQITPAQVMRAMLGRGGS